MPEKYCLKIRNILLFFLIALVFSCANMVSPTGGPKDITPPKVKNSEPLNYSANFAGNKIRITFNEYVLMEDKLNQIVISPPVDEEAEFNISKKSIVIDLPDKLNDSATYTIYFGESIKDLNEGNILKDFEFAFTRSNSLDSMSIKGQVLDALTLEPQKGILVMLYTADDDSTPMKHKPKYISKTNAEGHFLLKNLKHQKYKIFALKDMNSDMLFNQPTESIAFADSMLTPQYVAKIVDTAIIADTAKIAGDSLVVAKDTLTLPAITRSTALYLYVQPDTNQKLLKARADNYRRFKLYFKYPVRDFKVEVTNKQLPENWKTDDYSPNRDTITCWLSNPDMDTLKCIITDKGIIVDTVDIALKQKPEEKKPEKKPSGKGADDLEDIYKLGIKSSASASNMLPYHLPLIIKLSHPVAKTDYSKIFLTEKVDTVFKELKPLFSFTDTNMKRVFHIIYGWAPTKIYRLVVLPGAFTDVYGLTNDSLMLKFSANSPENYGRLLFKLKYTDSDKTYLVQLLNDNKTILQQKSATQNQQIIFDNLGPANYRIRIILDQNKNGKWDEGNYLERRQPEPVFYFPETINIRANWDTEYEFVL